jgi:hypothetical protein
MVEVTDGLKEGELVVLNPLSAAGDVESSWKSADESESQTARADTVASSQH